MGESDRAREIAFAASTITGCQGDYKAVISELQRLKVDSDNLRFLHEEVYPLLGWDGGETPPLTFLEELIDEVKQLRATAELMGRALRDYVDTQSRMYNEWDEATMSIRHHLLKDLHFCEPCGREALTALEAITPSPTSSPRCSDGSDT